MKTVLRFLFATTAIPQEKLTDNPMAEKLSKMLGQMAYEKELALKMVPMGRELFRARYGKSYL